MNPIVRMTGLLVTSLGLSVACGASLAPRELLDARDAFEQAKHGVASQYALAQLETAKQALQQAEAAFRDGRDEAIVDLAYVAERQAQLAEAAGELEKANRERSAALEEREDTQKDYRKRTKAELSAAQRELEETRRKSEAAGAAAAAELDAERVKRLAAEKKASAALASLEALAQVKEDQRGVVITLSGSVLFASGQDKLLPIAMDKLNEVARALKDQGYKKIVVEGHTDARGGDSNNLELSDRRAHAVRLHLVGQGIAASQISAVGRGETVPVAGNETPEGRANNRRVELIVTPE
ncbi:MAG: hypothetical protein RJA70_2390 [Pseudomonadota bacterium]|jgi:outer membrane protein OmpA-like peptidoglycan-associated protein